MSLRTLISVVALCAVVAGCAKAGSVPQAAASGVLRGSVSYRERVALPADAVVEVWLADITPLVMALPLVADTAIPSSGRQVPIPFELHYDPSRILSDRIYGVKAAIRSGGEILFASDTALHVITKGNPAHAELWLTRPRDQAAAVGNPLLGTSWRLVDLGNAAVLDGAEATLEFPEAAKVAGRGSCNRFFGAVEVSGPSIRFGPLGATRMSCEAAVNAQEARYLTVLQVAEHFLLEGTTLLVYGKGTERPLRFVRKEQ